MFVDELARLIAFYLVRASAGGGTPLLAGVAVAVVTGALTIGDTRDVPPDFYTVTAQIAPVLLVALVVEQRIANRFGSTEAEYARRAVRAWEHHPTRHDPDASREARKSLMTEWRTRYAELTWVRDIEDRKELKPTARKHYRRRVAVEAATVIVSVLALLVGQVAAILGVLDNGTSAEPSLFTLTATALATAFAIIVVSALVDLFSAVSKGLSSD
jgi:hypothetical protein